MKYGIKDLGWYLAWDQEGRYPISTTEPVEIVPDDGKLSIWFVGKPIQQSDGTWIFHKIIPALYNYNIPRYRSGSLWNPYKYSLTGNIFPAIFQVGEKKNRVNKIYINDLIIKKMKIYTDNVLYMDYKPQDNQTKLLIKNHLSSIYLEEAPIYKKDYDGSYLLDLVGNKITVNHEYELNYVLELQGYIDNIKQNTQEVYFFKSYMFNIGYHPSINKLFVEIVPIVRESKRIYFDIGNFFDFKITFERDNVIILVNSKEAKLANNFIFPTKMFIQKNENISVSYYNSQKYYYSKYSDALLIFKQEDLYIHNYNEIYFKDIIPEEWFTKALSFECFDYYSCRKYECFRKTDHTIMHAPIRLDLSGIDKPFYIGAFLNPLFKFALVKEHYKYYNGTRHYRTWSLISS